MSADAAAALETDGVTVAYGGIVALNDVSLSVRHGEVHGLIGPNGAGKSTLFDVIAGAQRPKTGRVLLEGVDVSRKSAVWRARRGVRRTFQRQQPLGWLTVMENVLAALEWQRPPGAFLADVFGVGLDRSRAEKNREAAAEMLCYCAIDQLADRSAAELSIGEARMVELARALVARPTLLMLDEPTSGLGEAESDRVAEIIMNLRRDARCSVVLVEHDVNLVMKVSDRVSVLALGSLVFQGTPEEVRRDEVVRKVYLGSRATAER